MNRRVVEQVALADLADVPARSRWVRSGALRLHVLDYARTDDDVRTPLLVVPGITTPAIGMDFVARELTDLVRPVVLDVRGRGLSDSADSYTLSDYADDVLAVVTGLQLHLPLLLGHSMGARIAGLAAVRAAGQRIPLTGSVLVDPPLSGPGRSPYPTTLAAFMGQLDAAVRGTTADEVAQSWPRWPRREQELRARWLSSCAPEAIEATHRGFESEDFFDFWAQVPASTVFVWGEDSPVVTAAGAGEARAAHPEAGFASIPGAGHMVFWDNVPGALAVTREVLVDLSSQDRVPVGGGPAAG
ncbi:alpha/beta fold hydrolase [Modestobacter sp. VKM Ac-2985]|uniref:alpha/beta fold hydrolase n=1 Tax=Modestobacter sp. VKM Ac-2985 TaxID=3004139 RepID=UPI0022ABA601|nr:alpha/beta hydrolase [Modestobacter sp. VKM Ac-2985]MCZ2837326.1 alpha/beta hydrolase [Modestobacter sp. VKM Ac-2985]